MKELTISGKQIERLDYLITYIEGSTNQLQWADIDVYVDWESLRSALNEMRQHLGLSDYT